MQPVVLLVRVDTDNCEDDGQDGERGEHDPDHHLADTSAIHGDARTAELADAVPRLVAVVGRARSAVLIAVSGHGRVGGGHVDRESVVGCTAELAATPSAPFSPA